jgi:excisionase family DNA binding protein
VSNDADLLTSVEVAKMLGLSRPYVNRLAARDLIPVAIKVPGKRGPRLFRREDVEARITEERAASQ